MGKHRIGVIGLGVMGRRMLAAVSTHPAFEAAAAWDLNPKALEAAGGLRIEPPEAMASAKDLALIHIATPPSTHIPLARLMIGAGKAVLCEKPLAVDLAGARRLVEESRGARQAVNFPFASSTAVETLERRIREGRAQRTSVEIRFHFSEWPRTWQREAAGWLAKRAEGGFVREVFSHFAYLTDRLIAPLKIRWSRVTFPADGVASETYVMAELVGGGIPVRVSGGVGGAAPDFNEWTIHGASRSFRLVDWGARIQASTGEGGWEDVRPDREAKPRLHDQLDRLDALIRGEKPSPLPDFAAGLRVAEVVEGLLAP